jgi:hypothetical protein
VRLLLLRPLLLLLLRRGLAVPDVRCVLRTSRGGLVGAVPLARGGVAAAAVRRRRGNGNGGCCAAPLAAARHPSPSPARFR